MGKNDFLTPKAIANRIKSKGLQKLRWYCQMCGKQCRDENGFKCHLSSESHKRQMMVFGENPDRVVQGYSEEFENTFMEHLRRSHPYSRVSAKNVYNEYIADRHHIHMNSTHWLTLTDFVQHLGQKGLCKVDQTPKGWFIVLVQKDPRDDLITDKRTKRHRAEREEEERNQALINEQVERAHKRPRLDEEDADPSVPEEADEGAAELQRGEDAQPLAFSMQSHPAPDRPLADAERRVKQHDPGFMADDRGDEKEHAANGSGPGRPKSKMETIIEQERAAAAATASKAAANAAAAAAGKAASISSTKRVPWLLPGLVVKVVSKALQEHGYYKKKGVVTQLPSKYIGTICMQDSGDLIQVDQAELETVLPQPGSKVKVVKGQHRGQLAEMLKVDVSKFQAQVAIKGKEVLTLWLEYEDVCKVDSK
ncbi:hypothetical protein WJX74_002787 [Apatococcus lobatus]|uniref:C2H2-type domain-containing protein n=1 Tax=Apatococcus lobatus TaxID=904363 RepID=A0AAW1Q9W1_9CHLO